MSIEVRAITEGDIEGFREALDSVAKEKRYLASFVAPPIDRVTTFVLGNIASNVSQFVALDGNQVIGWADISPERAEAIKHIGSLGMGIVTGYRGQGIGKRLLVACVEKAQQNGLTRIELQVRVDNENAIELYKKVGFQTEAVLADYLFMDGNYYDALQMSLVRRTHGN
ncbi:mycothiol acetyltransferase [mine drainage metagenome]|uniref:Mycothiol acetyltransferase n=1 Tax=mine drainage metagenome TaxID=410659 RepID=A0A1J5PP67_9ZZZZ